MDRRRASGCAPSSTAIDGVTVETDEAGNTWASAPGEPERFVIVGGHLDSVPNGGWLDGALNVLAGLEVLRALAPEERPVGIDARRLGRRGGRALRPQPDGLERRRRHARPRRRARADRPRRHGAAGRARRARRRARPHARVRARGSRAPPPTSSCTSSRGRCSSSWTCRSGAVLGTFGVQRHMVRFTGAHAHAGAIADAPAPRRVPRGRAQRARLARRRRRARRRARDRGDREGLAGDRDRVQRQLRGLARPARARRGRARGDARHGQGATRSGSRRRRAARSRGSRSGRSSRSCSTPS